MEVKSLDRKQLVLDYTKSIKKVFSEVQGNLVRVFREQFIKSIAYNDS